MVPVLELAEVIAELRAELQKAVAAGSDEALRFELGPIELEVAVGLVKGKEGGGKVRFWVLELGGEVKAEQNSTQRIKLTLGPRMTLDPNLGPSTPFVSGAERDRER
jgi:hypothetical protein